MFILFTLMNEDVSGSEDKKVYHIEDTEVNDSYLDELAEDFAEEENSLYGIEAGSVKDGVEVVGYTCNWEALENMTEEEIIEQYGDILEV